MPKPVKWTGYESLRTEHATHLVVQSHGSELTLLFFEFQPPFTTGTPEEQVESIFWVGVTFSREGVCPLRSTEAMSDSASAF